MHILQVEEFFHPDAGYQLNVLCKYLVKMGHQVTILTGEMEKFPDYLTAFFGRDHMEERDRAYEAAYGVRIIRLPLKAFVSGRAIFDKGRLLAQIRALAPELVYAHGNDTETAMWLLWNRRKLGCPIITDSHMLEMASQNRFNKIFRGFYRRVFTPILVRENITVIRTQDDPYVEKCLGIPLSQAPWISYGSDTMLFHPDTAARASFRREHGIPEDAFLTVYAGKLDESKGGQLLAEVASKPLHTQREVVWLIVGNTAGEYGAAVEAALKKSPYRVLRFSTQKYSVLASFFQAADLAVFPRQCSLSFYDVQACGLPVLSEDNNINVDRCSHHNGWNFRSEDSADFAAKLDAILALPQEDYAEVSSNALHFIQSGYDYAEKAREYETILLAAARKAKTE